MRFYKVFRDFQVVNEYGKVKEFTLFELLAEKTVEKYKLQRSENLEAVDIAKNNTYTINGKRYLDKEYDCVIAARGESWFSGEGITHINDCYVHVKFVRGDVSYYRRRKLYYNDKGVYFLDWYNRRAYLSDFLTV